MFCSNWTGSGKYHLLYKGLSDFFNVAFDRTSASRHEQGLVTLVDEYQAIYVAILNIST